MNSPHLASWIPGYVHPAEKNPPLPALRVRICRRIWRGAFRGPIRGVWAGHELGLDWGVVLFVDDVVHAVTVDQKILLKQQQSLLQFCILV